MGLPALCFFFGFRRFRNWRMYITTAPIFGYFFETEGSKVVKIIPNILLGVDSSILFEKGYLNNIGKRVTLYITPK